MAHDVAVHRFLTKLDGSQSNMHAKSFSRARYFLKALFDMAAKTITELGRSLKASVIRLANVVSSTPLVGSNSFLPSHVISKAIDDIPTDSEVVDGKLSGDKLSKNELRNSFQGFRKLKCVNDLRRR